VTEQPIRTALISVTDKAGLVPLASLLNTRGVRLLASSGTKTFLEQHGLPAEEVSEYTGSPEILDGRVKTLHPVIHGGLLADRGNPDHLQTLRDRGIAPIDLVVLNLYPFQEMFSSGTLDDRRLCEFIDIGGIALLRAAAKNYPYVAVVTHPDQYAGVSKEIEATGGTTLETRRRLARAAFELSAEYDSTIARFFRESTGVEPVPEKLPVGYSRTATLRYGENPHQTAAIYATGEPSPLLSLTQHQGKELSFNNYLDIAGAFALARDLGEGTAAVIKHTNPCGAAWCGSPGSSYRRALEGDPVSAFGGIVAVNGQVDESLAALLNEIFLEVVIARSYSGGALEAFRKKKNLRSISVPEQFWTGVTAVRLGLHVQGALLLQESDSGFPELDDLKVVSKRQPSEAEMKACRMGWITAKHVKSNAIVIADDRGTVGIGAGQMSRVDAAWIAVRKAQEAKLSLAGTSAASDAFFPFPDGVLELAEAGVSAIIQPGGSIRDQQVIEAADAANLAMIFTGRRHFRHI
jgi:phosphoribosylaminoimidazolecarboxamide formyltransferase/IMP cyclohydrolase